jgi:hypothetical protein
VLSKTKLKARKPQCSGTSRKCCSQKQNLKNPKLKTHIIKLLFVKRVPKASKFVTDWPQDVKSFIGFTG